MNIELLREVQKVILAEPQHFDMSDWHTTHTCGTAHCIGGWAEKLKYGTDVGFHPDGQRALELTEEESERLFYACDWPRQFKKAYYETSDRAEKAKIAAARIDHFIATEGAE